MLLKITHDTHLTYSEPISEALMELRMAPLQTSDQYRLSFDLAVGPPAGVTSYFDWLGNPVHFFTIRGFHREIRIVATSVVETGRPRRHPDQTPDPRDRWPLRPDAYDYSVYDFLRFGGPVVDSPTLRRLTEMLRPAEEMALAELAMRMIRLIDEQFTYEQGVTTAASPITDLLEHGRGVCQDFTHLMIGLARALKIPARYVSGFLHPHADVNGEPETADAARFRGYSQTHAWCELLFPSEGWVGFDATNRCAVGANFVKLAVGRDYRDVAPSRGVYRGKAVETIGASVHSVELPDMPRELAAERVRSLPIAVYAEGAVPQIHQVNQQQEIPQQEAQQQQ